MMNSSRKPSIFRIIQSDYLALIALVFPAVMWVMYFAIEYFGFFPGLRGHEAIRGSQNAPFFLTLATVTTLIGIPVLIWRIRSFQTAFARNVEVLARVTNITFFRDRGRVEYTYEYLGQTYQGGNAIMKTSRTRSLHEGEEVGLLVNPNNPKQAYIRDLYT